MKILLVSATKHEILPVLEAVNNPVKRPGGILCFYYKNLKIDLLISGVGMVAKAFSLGKIFNELEYDLALNAGIAGSFNKDIGIGSVVNVVKDRFSELGAEDEENFIQIENMNFGEFCEYPFEKGVLVNKTDFAKFGIKKLKEVTGITVNTVHGNKSSIKKITARFNPDVETMGGAAFLYACLKEKIPCAQIRSVSNFVEERNIKNWNIKLAVDNLSKTVFDVFDFLTGEIGD